MRTLLLLVLVALAACSNDEKLATCSGPMFALNAGRWTPQPADLTTPPRIGKAE